MGKERDVYMERKSGYLNDSFKEFTLEESLNFESKTTYFKKATISKAMALAIIPMLIFLLSGIISLNILLIITSVLFGIGHLIITYYNNV